MPTNLQNKKVLILGGGFGGLKTALQLSRKLGPDSGCAITLVDRADYHCYHPNMYEIAASDEELTGMIEMKKSVAIPFAEILPRGVEFIQGEIAAINRAEKTVTLGSGSALTYDYLVVALGSTTDFFNIPGIAEHALTLKTVSDALRIRNQCEFLVETHRLDVTKNLLRFVIGGGGFTGVELAGELCNLVRLLEWKFNYPDKKIELLVVEGMGQLIPGLSAQISEQIYWRLKNYGVEIRLNNFIKNVDARQITLSTGEQLNYDLLVWTGGVRAVPLPFAPAAELDAKGRIQTTATLQMQGDESIFALGDCAAVIGPDKRPLPQTATQAIAQSEYVSEALCRALRGEKLPEFRPMQTSYIIAVRGKWAALHYAGSWNMFGYLPWIAKRFADLHYFMQLMPFWRALQLTWMETKLYTRNDS